MGASGVPGSTPARNSLLQLSEKSFGSDDNLRVQDLIPSRNTSVSDNTSNLPSTSGSTPLSNISSLPPINLNSDETEDSTPSGRASPAPRGAAISGRPRCNVGTDKDDPALDRRLPTKSGEYDLAMDVCA